MKRKVIRRKIKNTISLIIGSFLLTTASFIEIYAQERGYNYNQKKFRPYTERLSKYFGISLNGYQGDLATFLQPANQNFYLNPGINFGLSYRFTNRISIRGDLGLFMLHAKTKETNPAYESFTSYNVDYYLVGVIDLFPKYISDGMEKRWDMHLLGGIGQIIFNPYNKDYQGVLPGKIIKGNDISEYNYARLSVQFPVGLGIKYYLNKDNHIAFEGIYHFTKTNFLDAVKNIDSPDFDKYLSFSIKFVKVIDRHPNKSFKYFNYLKNNKKRGLR